MQQTHSLIEGGQMYNRNQSAIIATIAIKKKRNKKEINIKIESKIGKHKHGHLFCNGW